MMGALLEGDQVPRKREGRERLSLRDPRIESLLEGLDLDTQTLNAVRSWSKAIWSARNAWDLRRRKGGLFSVPARLSKAEADARLRIEIQALKV